MPRAPPTAARAALAAGVLALLAGCVAPAPVGPLDPGGLPGYGYRCPGAAGPAGPDPCAALLGRDDATVMEPFVALHPGDPAVIAVGTNFGPSLPDRAAGLASSEGGRCRVGVFTSRDGGASWDLSFLPLPETAPVALPNQCAADPSLAFDADGRLHAAALYSPGSPLLFTPRGVEDPLRWLMVYTRSDDLGATWEPARVVHDEGGHEDRPWLVRDAASGRLWLTWQDVAYPPEEVRARAAWSDDRGDTWTVPPRVAAVACGNPSPVAPDPAGAVFVCDRLGGEEEFLSVRVDVAGGSMEVVGTLEEAGFLPQLVALPGPRLALLVQEGDGHLGRVRWSGDGGASWSAALDLVGLFPPGWAAVTPYAHGVDDAGGYHLVVRLSRPSLEVPAESEAWHLVLDPSGEVAHAARLGAWTLADTPVRPAQSTADDFHGFAWGHGRGVLATTRLGAVDAFVVEAADASG